MSANSEDDTKYEGHRTAKLLPGEYPYKCLRCDKRFKQIGRVSIHERSCTGRQKYECSYCNKKFIKSS